MDSRVSFREHIEKGHHLIVEAPPRLWLIPLTLRTRIQYYQEAADRIRAQVERLWQTSRARMSRGCFERMGVVKNIWEWGAPPWWD